MNTDEAIAPTVSVPASPPEHERAAPTWRHAYRPYLWVALSIVWLPAIMMGLKSVTLLGFALGMSPRGPLILVAGGIALVVAMAYPLVLGLGLMDIAILLSNKMSGDKMAPTTGTLILALMAQLAVGMIGFVAGAAMSRGRQLRRHGRVVLPPASGGQGWTTEPLVVHTVVPEARAVAAQWRGNARTEHASVAAFARLGLDLCALGAPPELLRGAHEDALDEIRHTELCYSLAKSLDGQDISPGAFPEAGRASGLRGPRSFALAQLAVLSLIDGALHEGVSARVVGRLAKTCPHPAIRAVLHEIASDEARHAAHGWDAVEWCLAEGGAPVAEALRIAARRIPERMTSGLAPDAQAGLWLECGIPNLATEQAEYQKTLAALRLRLGRLLDADTKAAA